jgi:hypothetical protein
MKNHLTHPKSVQSLIQFPSPPGLIDNGATPYTVLQNSEDNSFSRIENTLKIKASL